MIERLKNSSELKWIPDGFHFLGPEESKTRKELLSKIRDFFTNNGFSEVIPPSFDFSSSFYHLTNLEDQRYLLKSKDRLGDEISPSLDLTIQVVKGMSGFNISNANNKVYYISRVIRDKSNKKFGRRELLQAGIEVFGHSSGKTYTMLFSHINELISQLLGERKITIVLGNVKVISNLLEKFNFFEDDKNRFLNSLYDKDTKAIINLMQSKGIYKEYIEIVSEILLNFEPTFILKYLKERHDLLGESITSILKESEDLYEYSKKNFFNLDICLDFSLVRDLDYYTGFIFQGYMENSVNLPIISGGSYDKLFEKFSGVQKNACGFAFTIEEIEDLIKK